MAAIEGIFPVPDPLSALMRRAPGVALCTIIALVAFGLEMLERTLLGGAWLERLVLAILVGAVVRAVWTPGPIWQPGLRFSCKVVLEVSVVLIGAMVSAQVLVGAGPLLILGTVGLVAMSVPISYGIGRGFGLSHRLSILIACGNSICGNSAIAAVAPTIGADAEDVACSIAFTAVLGVATVLALPLCAAFFHLKPQAFGVFAGLTVYAVPQVLAATAAGGAVAMQAGTIVKLMRVLMLGPVVLTIALLNGKPALSGCRAGMPSLIPWFIIGFCVMAGLRSAGAISPLAASTAMSSAGALTAVAMAALGLSIDFRCVARAGSRTVMVVTLSLMALGGLAAAVLRLTGLIG